MLICTKTNLDTKFKTARETILEASLMPHTTQHVIPEAASVMLNAIIQKIRKKTLVGTQNTETKDGLIFQRKVYF